MKWKLYLLFREMYLSIIYILEYLTQDYFFFPVIPHLPTASFYASLVSLIPQSLTLHLWVTRSWLFYLHGESWIDPESSCLPSSRVFRRFFFFLSFSPFSHFIFISFHSAMCKEYHTHYLSNNPCAPDPNDKALNRRRWHGVSKSKWKSQKCLVLTKNVEIFVILASWLETQSTQTRTDNISSAFQTMKPFCEHCSTNTYLYCHHCTQHFIGILPFLLEEGWKYSTK